LQAASKIFTHGSYSLLLLRKFIFIILFDGVLLWIVVTLGLLHLGFIESIFLGHGVLIGELNRSSRLSSSNYWWSRLLLPWHNRLHQICFTL